MSHFRKDQDDHWWFHVTGKGNKQHIVTACDAMPKALKRYRQGLGLSPLPVPTEQIPLIASRRGRGPVPAPATSDASCRPVSMPLIATCKQMV
jgi:hypothetical protein